MIRPPAFIGIVGWKSSGKTTLVERLIPLLARRGLKVMTVKHTHHDLGPLSGSTDGERHQRAGSLKAIVIAPDAWEISGCRQIGPPPSLCELSAHVANADLVIVEGFKDAPIPKIELRRQSAEMHRPLATNDTRIVAIASDHSEAVDELPSFALDNAEEIATFIAAIAR
ncbi:molybdopterin-guanine dinucleotide biosynthesis adapter protein [Hyphomicrobium sp. 1Nfss2.1]|uniref:molybdopterin-guanine dinucleotide biosynthesis protein B n=1 Tax=Hyphomicrobium sp. 1Nfss2.1 TaxID=3413936 RepID=UPI003C7BA32B